METTDQTCDRGQVFSDTEVVVSPILLIIAICYKVNLRA